MAPRRVLLAVLLASSAVGAQAGPTNYQCTGYKPLQVTFSPDVAQVLFEDQHRTLKRVRAGGQARYVAGATKAGLPALSLQIKQGTLQLQRGDETLQCKLISDALAKFYPASAPSAPAGSR